MLRATIASLLLSMVLTLPLVLASAPDAAAEPGPVFKIVSEDGADERRSVSVRLATRVSETDIRRLVDGLVAKRLPSSGAGAGAGRIIVKFYLDGMTLDQAPWATATYQSDLKISISGLKLEEEELYLSELRHDRRQLVGAWLTSPPAIPGRLAIFRDKGKVFAEWRLRNGLKTVDELVESRVNRGRRYDVKGEMTGHFVVTAQGALELREGDKLIALAEQVPPARLVPAPAVMAQPSGPAAAGNATSVGQGRAAAAADATTTAAEVAPITASLPKPSPQVRKRVVKVQSPHPVKSAARGDSGPIMRLQGQ